MKNKGCDGEVSSSAGDADVMLDGEIAEAVRDIEGKRAEMKLWKREIERRKRVRWRNVAVFVPLLTAAACAVVCVLLMKPARPGIVLPDESELRGGTSYDMALQRADSLIVAGDSQAADAVLDSIAERAGYEKALLDGVLERVGELREKIGSTASK